MFSCRFVEVRHKNSPDGKKRIYDSPYSSCPLDTAHDTPTDICYIRGMEGTKSINILKKHKKKYNFIVDGLGYHLFAPNPEVRGLDRFIDEKNIVPKAREFEQEMRDERRWGGSRLISIPKTQLF